MRYSGEAGISLELGSHWVNRGPDRRDGNGSIKCSAPKMTSQAIHPQDVALRSLAKQVTDLLIGKLLPEFRLEEFQVKDILKLEEDEINAAIGNGLLRNRSEVRLGNPSKVRFYTISDLLAFVVKRELVQASFSLDSNFLVAIFEEIASHFESGVTDVLSLDHYDFLEIISRNWSDYCPGKQILYLERQRQIAHILMRCSRSLAQLGSVAQNSLKPSFPFL